eukprot:981766_1
MAQNENEDNNKRQTRSQSHSSSHLSRPSTPSKSSIPSILLSQFQEYDHSNNGFLNWDEFCAMCSDKNINEDERDTYWKELGGENQNSTISYQQDPSRAKFIRKRYIHRSNDDESITDRLSNDEDEDEDDTPSTSIYEQTKSRKEIANIDGARCQSAPATANAPHVHPNPTLTKQQHHSDDEHMREAHRLVRSSTAKSEFSVSVTTLFERGPLKVFERFDMEQNGTLNVSQFVQMVNALYPTPTSDDHKDQDEDDKVIKDTFVQVDCDKSDRLDYRDGVHDLEAELDRFGENKPNKTEFLNLCVEVFGNKNEFNVMNELTNANPIGEVRTCINTFAEHVESGGKHQYRFAKLTVEQLAQWIEKHGIPSIVKIEELQREYDTLLRHKSKVDSDLVRKHDEQVLTKRFLDETGEDKAKLENDLKQCQYTKRMLQTRCDNVCEQLEVVQNQLNKTKNDLKIAKKAQKKMRSDEDEIEELRAQRESLQNQLELYCERHQITKTTVNRFVQTRHPLEFEFDNMKGATTHHHLMPAHPDSDSDEFERNDYEESERFTHTRRYSDESDTNIGSIMSTDGHHQRVPSTVGLSDRDEPLFHDNTGNAMYSASDHYVEPMMDTAQLQEQIASQLKQCFQDQAQQIKQLLQAAHQPNELQKNTMQTMVDIKKNCKLTELEIAKQSDNLKEHFQQQTHQIKADLNTFQRNMTEQLSQSMHQPNEAKDESTVADTVPQVNQTIPPLTREEWQDLQNKTNQTMQTMADIKKNWKQTAKQNDNLKKHLEEQTQQIKGDLNELQQHMKSQLLQSMHQPNEAKDESTVADIVQNTPPVTTDEWQWEKMEHAIDGLRSQLNAHDKSFAKIQNSLGVCTHISTSAIESAQDKIQMTQLHAETESATKFSSLGYNLYSMKKQLHDALDVLNTLKTTLPQVIAKTVKAAQIHEEEDEDEDDDDDIKHCTKDSTLKVLESQIGKEMTIVLQSQLIDDAIHKSKQELMDYMDLKFEHKQQSELLAKECKEEEEYTNAQRLDDAEQGQRKDALLAQFIESNSQVLDATSDIKKETERLMSLLRTLVGLDVAQTMRFANDQNETLIKKIQTRMDDISARIAQQGRVTKEHNQTQMKQIQARMDAVCAQITEQKEANRVNDRFNDSIKSHTKLLQQMFAESDETIKTELEHSSQSWFHQLRKYQDSTNRNFDELKKDVKVTNQTNHFGDEYTTKMMAKIRANQSSCWRDTGCGLFAAMAANFFFVILFFAHKGHYA